MQKNNIKGKSLSIIIILLMLFGVFSMDYSVYAASHDNVITNIKMTKISGETLEPVGMWDTVKVNAKFSLPNNTVHEGDTTTIQLPDQLTFISDTAFDVKDAGGNVVAKATIDSSTKKITLTYTNYPETHSNVTGEFFFLTRVDHAQFPDQQTFDINFKVGTTVVYGGKLEFKGVGVPTPETFAKVGWKGSGDNKRLLSYKICINQTKNKIDNAVVSDTPQEGVKLKRESLRILKGKWVVKLGNYELNPMQDVTDQHTVNWKPDDRGFSINLGNIGEEDGYELWYDA